jgi:hypothetical protein
MARPPERDVETTQGAIPLGRALRWYFALLMLGIVVSVVGDVVFGVDPLRGSFAYCGVLFLSAGGADWPHTAFLVIRNIRWFGSIREDFIVRWIMIGMGFFLLAFAVVAPAPDPW